MKGVVYANISADHRFAIGYLQWYQNNWRYMSADMFSRQYDPETLLAINQKLEKAKFRFSNHVRKTHHVNIPVDVMMMKMKGFLRQIADEVIEERNKPVQLEFNFGEEK